jgi:glycosyltransferase involved in cell wall biosynthesis
MSAADGPVPATTRNAHCPCGSGLRYKACHGRRAPAPAAVDAGSGDLLRSAIDMHRQGRLPEARALYQRALARDPGAADAAHMLGVVQLCEGDHEGALRTLLDVVRRFEPAPAEVVHNLAIAVAALLAVRAPVETEALWLDYLAARAAPPARPTAGLRVSVVVPSYNHAAYVEAAVASALAQTRAADEVVVIDDGSTDSSVARLRAIAAREPRLRFVARENRGAAATINEAVRLSRGDFVNVLNSDDRFAPDRLEAMLDAVAGAGASWGYSRCAFVDGGGAPLAPGAHPQADRQRLALDRAGTFDTIGFAFLAGNPATSTGALFFARRLFDAIGGFEDLRYVHDWAFCLSATLLDEPVFVPRDLYEYRLHGANTVLAGPGDPEVETRALGASFHRRAAAHDGAGNRWAPVPAVWGRTYALRAIEAGTAALLPPGTIERLAEALVAEVRR